MPVHITLIGENAEEVLVHLRQLASGTGLPATTLKAAKAAEVKPEPKVTEAEVVEETKPKAEKKAAVKKETKEEAKVETPEAPKYTLNDIFDRVREIAGDGTNDKIMAELKAINTRLGVAKVRELPADKMDVYMGELAKSFPSGVAPVSAAVDDMFA